MYAVCERCIIEVASIQTDFGDAIGPNADVNDGQAKLDGSNDRRNPDIGFRSVMRQGCS